MIYFVKPLNDGQKALMQFTFYIATFLTKINKGIFSVLHIFLSFCGLVCVCTKNVKLSLK